MRIASMVTLAALVAGGAVPAEPPAARPAESPPRLAAGFQPFVESGTAPIAPLSLFRRSRFIRS